MSPRNPEDDEPPATFVKKPSFRKSRSNAKLLDGDAANGQVGYFDVKGAIHSRILDMTDVGARKRQASLIR